MAKREKGNLSQRPRRRGRKNGRRGSHKAYKGRKGKRRRGRSANRRPVPHATRSVGCGTTPKPPKSALGKAVAYTLDNWQQLISYVDDPVCTPSNNKAENAIRPFVIGRKNWLFSGTPAGAEASAIHYSLIESAKLNRLNPFEYLHCIYSRLPYAKTQEDFISLLPFNLDPEKIRGG